MVVMMMMMMMMMMMYEHVRELGRYPVVNEEFAIEVMAIGIVDFP